MRKGATIDECVYDLTPPKIAPKGFQRILVEFRLLNDIPLKFCLNLAMQKFAFFH